MGSARLGVDHLLGVAVVGGHHEQDARVLARGLEDAEAAVERLDRDDRLREFAGVAHHVGVGEVDDMGAELPVPERADRLLGDLRGAHLGVKVVRRSPPGRNEDPLLARIRLLDAAVEEVRDVGVLLGLGQAQIRDAPLGPDVREDACPGARRERGRQIELRLVFREADEVELRRLRPRKVGKPGFGQRARDLPGAVRPEIEEHDRVPIDDRADGLAVLGDHRRLDELVGLAARVGGLDGRRRSLGAQAGGEHQRLVGAGHAVPALVAVHGVVAAGDRGDLPAEFRERRLEARDVAGRGPGRRVAPVREDVHPDARHAGLARELQESFEVALVRVDPAVGHQPHQVQGRAPAPGVLDGGRERGVLEERSVAQREVDAEQILRHHPPGAERQVPDLGVAHESGRQSHGFAGGLEERPRELRQPAVVDRSPGARDRIALRRRRMTPAVADQEEKRGRLQARGAGRRRSRAASRTLAGRGSRRSRSETTCM